VHGARFDQLDLDWPDGVGPIIWEDVSSLVADQPRQVGLVTVDGDDQ
jgi:hypothetical protein